MYKIKTINATYQIEVQNANTPLQRYWYKICNYNI